MPRLQWTALARSVPRGWAERREALTPDLTALVRAHLDAKASFARMKARLEADSDAGHAMVLAYCEGKGWDPDVKQWEDLTGDEQRELFALQFRTATRPARPSNPVESFKRDLARMNKRWARKARQQRRVITFTHGARRESRALSPGHRRVSSASTGPPGDDPPSDPEPPHLSLAPRPAAIYTFGVRAREEWGLE